jgi:hypothetical protein
VGSKNISFSVSFYDNLARKEAIQELENLAIAFLPVLSVHSTNGM